MHDLIWELAGQFLEFLRVDEDRSNQTLATYSKRLGQYARWAERYPGDPLTADGYRAYFGELKQRGLGQYTRKGHYHILKRFGDWLVDQGWLDANAHPIGTIRPPRVPRAYIQKAISPEDAARMLAVCVAENFPNGEPLPGEFYAARNRAILLFLRDTGCRAGELLSLKWGSMNLVGGQSHVTGKGGVTRPLFFTAVTIQALAVYRLFVPDQVHDPVWHGREGKLTYGGLIHIMRNVGKLAGVTGPHSAHAFRHAFGRDTHLLGAPTAVVQDLMGHSSIRTTRIYSRFSTDQLKKFHERVSPVRGGD